MLGKTSVGALAYGDIWYGGRTNNPWNVEEGSSGSSAGSAAAVAAGLVAFSLGTETLGSIVAPSLRCGATGLRPTFGRTPRTGAMPLCWTLDKIGPIARTATDTALVLAVINGADGVDPFVIDAALGFDAGRAVKGIRVGYYPKDFAADLADDLDRYALESVRGLGVDLVALERPELPYGALMSALTAEAAASFEALTLTNEDDTLAWQEPGAWPNTFRKARFLSAIDHIQLDRLRRRIMQDMDAAFRGVEAMIGPCLAGPMLIITNSRAIPASSCAVASRIRQRACKCSWLARGLIRARRRLCQPIRFRMRSVCGGGCSRGDDPTARGRPRTGLRSVGAPSADLTRHPWRAICTSDAMSWRRSIGESDLEQYPLKPA
jgi:Asp-tRNA(Asn)/Glu-tRNA(Gln) amidotransferase A subunit family amidase